MGDSKTVKLDIEKIRLDGGTQSRKTVNEQVLRDYAEAWERGDEFPPPVAYHDGEDYWLSEGFHRVGSAKLAGRKHIMVEVRKGLKRDALLNSLGSNARHGLQRTNEDKRHAVKLCLADPEWSKWANRQIAKICCVSESLVRSMRDGASAFKTQMRSPEVLFERNGKTYSMKLDKAIEKVESESEHGEEDDGRDEGASATKSQMDDNGEATADDASNDADGASDQEDSEEASAPAVPTVDDLGIPIQPHAAESFAAQALFDELIKTLRQCSKLYAELADHPGGAFLRVPGVSINSRERWKHKGIETAIMNLKDCRPSLTVCPYAYNPDHAHEKDCSLCQGLNWVRTLEKGRVSDDLIKNAKDAFHVPS